ncbi:MAG: hypothetical protein A2051_08020 [Desulfovibrionales bacterium GWA2_65_9]|nr:MAG: hypothetical protein A2051_08020 [Desulfovibrionales bacterium GWA2_65_9]
MRQHFMSIADASAIIEEGRTLILAGDESALRQMPQGDWIGGTIPYFITDEHGGVSTREKVFVTDLTGVVTGAKIAFYDQSNLSRVYAEGPQHGFSFIIIPASNMTHLFFALKAPSFKEFGVRPLIGWIAGVHLDDLGKKTPKVFNGQTGEAFEEGALVLQAELPANKVAEIGIMNLFEQGDGDTLVFPADGFVVKSVLVNGEKMNLAAYLLDKKLDTRLPLVADYSGARVNISFQAINEADGTVQFYAPVFSGVRYKHAKPVGDYIQGFEQRLKKECSLEADRVVFSCNCILNYLYSELEGKKTDPFTGPMTFGEIAYQLLNQTLVYLQVHEV